MYQLCCTEQNRGLQAPLFFFPKCILFLVKLSLGSCSVPRRHGIVA